MTPKEKARELYIKFSAEIPANSECDPSDFVRVDHRATVNCVIIACNEIISQWEYIHTYIGDGNGELNPNLRYWNEVLTELKSMQ